MASFVLAAGSKRYVAQTGPRAPSGLVATALSSTSIRLTWTNHSISADNIEIDRSLNGSSWSTITSSVDSLDEEFTDTGRTPETTYYYRLRALGTPNDSAYSNTASATTPEDGSVAAVQLLPTWIESARVKVTGDTDQYQDFIAVLSASLNSVISNDYLWTPNTLKASDYAFGYLLLKDSDPETALEFGGKAVGLANSWGRDNHSATAGAWQSVGTGNGVTTSFPLPGTSIVTASLTVYNLATGSPAGTGGGTVNPSGYSVVGTNLVFTVAPASGRTIWITCVYHTAALPYQQTGNGAGGISFLATGADNLYPDRGIGLAVASVIDWCSDLPGWSGTQDQTDLIQFAVDLFDLSVAQTYAPADWTASNYGAGRLLCQGSIAISVAGRHAEADRLGAAVVTLYTNSVSSQFGTPTSTVSSLKGGWPGEGGTAYGPDTAFSLLIAVSVISDSDLDFSETVPGAQIATWAGELIRCQIHSRYAATVVNVSGSDRPGVGVSWGDNSIWPSPVFSTQVLGVASGISSDTVAAAYGRYLIANGGGSVPDGSFGFIFYDPDGTATNWVDHPTEIGTAFLVQGSQAFTARSDWTYSKAFVAAYYGNRKRADHDEPGPSLEINRGSARLLIDAAALGDRYNNDPCLAWANGAPVIDDGGTQNQTNRWNGSALFGVTPSFTRPGITLQSYEDGSDYVVMAVNVAAYYARNTTGTTSTVNTLERRIVFVPAAELIYVSDIVSTKNSAYPIHLRWHKEGTVHPVGSGTFTLSNGSGSTSALAWNADAATIQAALRGLTGTGYSTCVVTKKVDGNFLVNFTSAGTTATVAALTGTASATDALVEVFDLHPGASGARTLQEIFLTLTVTGSQVIDSGTDRAVVKVSSPDALLVTDTLVGTKQFGGTEEPIRRVAWRPNSAVAATRFGTLIQLMPTASSEVASTYLTGTGSKLHGYKVGQNVILDKTGAWGTAFVPTETVAITASGTVTWRVFGLIAGLTYSLSGAAVSTAVATASGTLVFTTTATNPSVTISVPAPAPTVYARTTRNAIFEAGDTLPDWYTSEQTRQALSSPYWWQWQLNLHPGTGNGDYPWFMVSHHGGTNNPGVRFFRNNFLSNGNALTGAFENVTQSVLGGATPQPGAGGTMNPIDIDGDGQIDYVPTKNEAPYQKPYRIVAGSLVAQNGTVDAYASYPFEFYVDGNGRPGFRQLRFPPSGDLTAFSEVKVKTFTWNAGTSTYDSVLTDFALPAGVPGAVAADVLARVQATVGDSCTVVLFHMDLNEDGITDLVIFGRYAYVADEPITNQNFAYYLQNDGAGNYTDMTAAWGLPLIGWFMPLRNYWQTDYRFLTTCYPHLHRSLDAAGNFYIFIAGGGASTAGVYRWNGSGYTRVTGALTTLLGTALRNAAKNAVDDYEGVVYACDLRNTGVLDVVYQQTRRGMVFPFLSNNDGTWTQHLSVGYPYNYFVHWTPYGFSMGDMRNSGQMDLLFGGNDGTTTNPGGSQGSGGATARSMTIYENATTSPGRYVKVRVNLTGSLNPFAVTGKVGVYTAGQSFAPSALIREWACPYNGLPLVFGVGTATTVDIRLTKPDGSTSDLTAEDTSVPGITLPRPDTVVFTS